MRALIVFVMLALTGCGQETPSTATSPAPPSPSQSSSDPAADLVRNFRMGANLEQMANDVAASTHTYATVSPVDVKARISRLAPKYQAEWDANLARAHAAHLSPEELRSLASEGRRSPFHSKLERQRPAIAADMKAASSGLLQRLVREALMGAAERS
ncbi:hypothetical protein ACWKWK_03040 [Pseudoxanthomonas beigongshangi]